MQLVVDAPGVRDPRQPTASVVKLQIARNQFTEHVGSFLLLRDHWNPIPAVSTAMSCRKAFGGLPP
jgi:hypothetical protein